MIIGIDPDLDKSGVAVVVNGQLQQLHGMCFFDLIKYIDEHADDAFFVLEDVEASKPTYGRALNERNRSKREAIMKKIAQDVGKVKATGRFIRQYLEGCGARFVAIPPLRGNAKKAKKDAEFFNKITGWTGKSNEDKRDAAMLALYGIPKVVAK